MSTVVIGNIVSLIGAALMVAIGFLKRRRLILTVQCFQFGIMGLGHLILGGITGLVTSLVSIARNLICCRWKLTAPLKAGFILAQILLSAGVNNAGLIGWLPVVSCCLYTLLLDVKTETALKLVIIVTVAMWVIYDFYFQNYAAFAFDLLTILTNTIGIFQLHSNKVKANG